MALNQRNNGAMSKPDLAAPLIPTEEALELLQLRLQSAVELVSSGRVSEEQLTRWRSLTESTLERIWGEGSRRVAPVRSGPHGPAVYYAGQPPTDWEGKWNPDWIREVIPELEAQIDYLRELPKDAQQPAAIATSGVSVPQNNKVFVVHGHNNAARESIATCLRKLDLDPIILHEKANEGKTIIEKLEKHADVGFAVVLLTPDDVGGVYGGKPREQRPRARQNVLLELGYFMGRLGRSHVCPLRADGVEIPSDALGIVYVPLDSGGAWRFELVKELKAAGYTVDANRLV